MQTLQHSYTPAYSTSVKSPSILLRFINWCNGQEKYRFGWLAVMLTIHGCVLTPITVLTITLGGNSMLLWGLAIGAMAMPLIVNLAAMPTKITIPVFFFSILLDIVVVTTSIVYALNTF
jgi:hypothetical protein